MLLFKLFIIPHFDYCSTLFTYLKNKGDRDRLSMCFIKCVYRLLNIDLYNLTEYQQFLLIFEKYKILPLIYRQFFHFSCFLYNLMSRKNCKLFNKLNEKKKKKEEREINTRSTYDVAKPKKSQKLFFLNYFF